MSRKPWFRGWFGREYLALYPHRDRAEARLAVALLRETTGLGPGTQVLDVGCGPGRHLEELDHIGYLPVGLGPVPGHDRGGAHGRAPGPAWSVAT